MAHAAKDTQQIYVGYKENATLDPKNAVIGDVKIVDNSATNGTVYFQFVNGKKELTRTDIIKKGQVKYIAQRKGVELNDNLYTHTLKVEKAIGVGTKYVINVIVPDYYPTNIGAMKSITAVYIQKSGDTVKEIANGLCDSLLKTDANEVGVVFNAEVDTTDTDTIKISEVFFKEFFKLGLTPCTNFIKRLVVTCEPSYDNTNKYYVSDWCSIKHNVSSVSANNYLYKLQEMEWFNYSYRSNFMKHMDEWYDYMIPKPQMLITSVETLPAGVQDLDVLDIHYEEAGDGSILSQKNMIFIAPGDVLNTMRTAIEKCK